MIRDREPHVFLRRGDTCFRMNFSVGGRRYFGPTPRTDREAALSYAREAYAMTVAWRDWRQLGEHVAKSLAR